MPHVLSPPTKVIQVDSRMRRSVSETQGPSGKSTPIVQNRAQRFPTLICRCLRFHSEFGLNKRRGKQAASYVLHKPSTYRSREKLSESGKGHLRGSSYCKKAMPVLLSSCPHSPHGPTPKVCSTSTKHLRQTNQMVGRARRI